MIYKEIIILRRKSGYGIEIPVVDQEVHGGRRDI